MSASPQISTLSTNGGLFQPPATRKTNGATATIPQSKTHAQCARVLTPAVLSIRINDLDPTIEVKDFTDPQEYKQAYDDMHEEVIRASEAAADGNIAVIRALGKMRVLLSQRGNKELRKKAGIKMGWGQYFKWHKQKYGLKQSLRATIYQIDALGGKKRSTKPADPIPHLNNAARRALIEGNHKAVEIVTALEAGRDAQQEIAAFKAVMNAKRLDDILTAAEGEAAVKATKEFSWQDLIDRLETLVPTVEDGSEHVIVDKLETGILRVQAGEKADPRVVLLCQRIAANFAAYVKSLDPTAVATHPDVVHAEELRTRSNGQRRRVASCRTEFTCQLPCARLRSGRYGINGKLP
jgi:hypothetical protein